MVKCLWRKRFRESRVRTGYDCCTPLAQAVEYLTELFAIIRKVCSNEYIQFYLQSKEGTYITAIIWTLLVNYKIDVPNASKV